MSRSVDLFFDSDDDAAIAAVTTAATAPVARPDGTWAVDLGDGAVATLGRHDFVDDGDLMFSRYPWNLWVRVPNEGPLLDHPATVALREVSTRLRGQGLRVLTVVDLQHRLDGAADRADAVERADAADR